MPSPVENISVKICYVCEQFSTTFSLYRPHSGEKWQHTKFKPIKSKHKTRKLVREGRKQTRGPGATEPMVLVIKHEGGIQDAIKNCGYPNHWETLKFGSKGFSD